MRRFSFAAAVGAALALSAATVVRATDIIEYSFNTGPLGWYSAPDEWVNTAEGSNEKSWKLLVTGSTEPTSYLYSPCFISTDSTVQFDFNEHRFNFGLTGTTGTGLTYVPPAGQVQYSTDGGMTWSGIPLAKWSSSGVNEPPTLDPASLAPTTTALLTSGYAFQGMSLGYDDANPKFIKSSFTLTSLTIGGELQFRLLGDFGGTSPAADPGKPAWDVDNVQIKGVIECVPEPGTLALASIGGLCCLLLVRRRRNARLRAALGSTAATVAAGVVIVSILFAVPARAAPDAVPVADWNFATGTSGLGWTSQTFAGSGTKSFSVPASYAGQWAPPSVLAPYWHDNPTRGAVAPSFTVQYLTSPVITVPQKVDALDFIIRHRFNFPTNITTGAPLVVGELAWRYYDPAHLDAAFQPFAPAVFATGTVPPPYNVLSPDPNWVPNNYTVGTFGAPPLVTGGGAWVGASPGWAQHDFVMSQVFLDGGLTPGQQVQFRFINAVVGVECTGSEWDVSRVTVIGQLPEPGGMALAAIGAGSAAVGLVVRGRRGRLTSGPRARA